MSQDRGQGIGDRAGVARVHETLHAGRYFVTDAILLAGELEQTRPIRTLSEVFDRIDSDAVHLLDLLEDPANFDTKLERFRAHEQFRLRLVRVAATAMQAAKQLGLDSRQDAIAKEIPF